MLAVAQNADFPVISDAMRGKRPAGCNIFIPVLHSRMQRHDAGR
ncbi:hypothetical protein K788_0005259 [Paraburkholderia caribensis MBA4]|uniref:Uncharacterized protein n=1 Tax=Paraburkholderia caribensis MBA4 TaxID=1323664 RepID=A0A0P0RF25_9BURK|nr:hypothetical protein K788_0005259 [Paraburkholderia caribensis MBA4]